MKKGFLLSIILLASFVSCANENDLALKTITYKEYINKVSNEVENDRDIFIFTTSTCTHCQKIRPLLNKYVALNPDVNIFELSLDVKISTFGDNTYIFKDSSMGYFTGDAKDDCIKSLDNRIALYANANNLENNSSTNALYSPIDIEGNSKYMYVYTPLIIFYESGLEVNIINNVDSLLTYDKKNKIEYDSFAKIFEFPTEKNQWDKPFDLTYSTAFTL